MHKPIFSIEKQTPIIDIIIIIKNRKKKNSNLNYQFVPFQSTTNGRQLLTPPNAGDVLINKIVHSVTSFSSQLYRFGKSPK
jgi:hypothetical protein